MISLHIAARTAAAEVQSLCPEAGIAQLGVRIALVEVHTVLGAALDYLKIDRDLMETVSLALS